MKKVLITDLDDTLYNWTEFFISSFYAMVKKLSETIQVDEDTLLSEYRSLNQKYGNVEHPYVTLDLPSVKKYYANLNKEEIRKSLDEVFHTFNSTRLKTLKLYDGVRETLLDMFNRGIVIIGYTESPEENGYYRLKKLGIDKLFTELYVLDSDFICNAKTEVTIKIHKISKLNKKPNPSLLRTICEEHQFVNSEVAYIGDSLTKDVYMAKCAGITSIWAKYGIPTDPTYYQRLVKISHWTNSDFIREKELKEKCKGITPDYTIMNFNEIKSILY